MFKRQVLVQPCALDRYPIFDSSATHKQTGEVRLFMRYATPLLAGKGAARDWELVCNVLACKGLPSMDHLSKNDVYVKVEAAGCEWPRQTSTVPSWGNRSCQSCTWGQNGEGEARSIELYDVPAAVGVSVFDEDENDDEDDLIGQCVLEVGEQIFAHMQSDAETPLPLSEWSTQGWFELTESKRGKSMGEVQLKVYEYTPFDCQTLRCLLRQYSRPTRRV
eukprot:COSAG02_NODE_3767_length_6268_cov_2.428757_7_plen_220_part_00